VVWDTHPPPPTPAKMPSSRSLGVEGEGGKVGVRRWVERHLGMGRLGGEGARSVLGDIFGSGDGGGRRKTRGKRHTRVE